jgi:hypothetical protein
MKSSRGKTEASMDELRMPDDDVPLLGKQASGQSWLARKQADFVQLFSAAYWRAKLTPETLRILLYFFLLVLFGIGTSSLPCHHVVLCCSYLFDTAHAHAPPHTQPTVSRAGTIR